jgi:monofunctional biosynthetic peptidoglycan transglycosylase
MRVLARAARVAALALGGALLLSVLAVLTLRFIPPWTTAFIMEARVTSWFDDDPRPWKLQREWRDLDAISPQVQLAVIAAEDQRFFQHAGFDFRQIRKALERRPTVAGRNGRPRGASTISQQVAKNLFLWNGRSWVRKGIEAWFTVLVELLWPKQRILEVYLNIAEFGRGIYGVEAASQAFYRKSAARLSRAEGARLAAVLPNPIRLRADKPSKYVQRRQREIEAQMRALGGTAYLQQPAKTSVH